MQLLLLVWKVTIEGNNMSISDTGIPAIDPHTMLSSLITTNMTSPDGVWTPIVNSGWLEFKRQKTYQISIVPLYTDSDAFNLTGGASSTQPRISTGYYTIVLYAPTRAKLWSLFQKLMLVLNNETLTSPQSGSGMSGVGGSDYHFVRVVRSEDAKTIEFKDSLCGIDIDKTDVTGYRAEITVSCRWNE